MLQHGHDHYLVVASLAIALMSGFTGLSLTQGASRMSIARRKLVVSMSAIALGSGIWSMHFVAMLGMTLPVQFYYDALITLISAFVAILLTGIALLLVHFGTRTGLRITLAGICLAAGILAMHYIGMSGIQGVRPIYSAAGLGIAILAAFVLCIASFWISYGGRENRNILIGTLGFGVAVVSVHFVAMAGTHFELVEGMNEHAGFWLDNSILAFGVTVSSFVISGAFLLVSVSFAGHPQQEPLPAQTDAAEDLPATESTLAPQADVKIPFEQNGRIHFASSQEVTAVRAEGRYTFIYNAAGRLFSPWSISEMDTKLAEAGFIRCHRSYLINPKFVSGFERKKDNGVCYFEDTSQIEKAPVSRSYLKAVRERLGV
ncbi:MHYT domain-containing protein [Roseobacter weihaiensis]|uniref:MHYT domain-containing protein n=1 Tax=Roseobacter weihaiensis TaxID=2763262 RepID=UPI001D0A5703|nr:MHYT domain-containing protein [Roseobacter sp. H9]